MKCAYQDGDGGDYCETTAAFLLGTGMGRLPACDEHLAPLCAGMLAEGQPEVKLRAAPVVCEACGQQKAG